MLRIAVALLAIAFVPARVSGVAIDDTNDGYVSDLYSATDRRPVGSFNYSLIENIPGLVKIMINNPLHFVSKFPYVVIALYGAGDVLPGCKIAGPMLLDENDAPVIIYAGKDVDIIDKSIFLRELAVNLTPWKKYSIVDSIVVVSSMNAENPIPTPIACGSVHHITSDDSFFQSWSMAQIFVRPSIEPSTLDRASSISVLNDIQAVTDLYSPCAQQFLGSIVYKSSDDDNLELAVLPVDLVHGNATTVAVVYHEKDVIPGCATTGPAVTVYHEGGNGTEPLTLFMEQPEHIQTPIYATTVKYASLGRADKYYIVGHVVVVYSLESENSTVLDDFLKPTNPHIPIACGIIRYADEDEDNFLKWTPAGPKPDRMSEAKRMSAIVSSIAQGYEKLADAY